MQKNCILMIYCSFYCNFSGILIVEMLWESMEESDECLFCSHNCDSQMFHNCQIWLCCIKVKVEQHSLSSWQASHSNKSGRGIVRLLYALYSQRIRLVKVWWNINAKVGKRQKNSLGGINYSPKNPKFSDAFDIFARKKREYSLMYICKKNIQLSIFKG